MKKKSTRSVRRIVGSVGITLVIVIWVLINYIKPNNMQYSFKNNGYLGNMLFYDALKQLDYHVEYQLMPFTSISNDKLAVINAASYRGLEEDDVEAIKSYALNGGRALVLLNGGYDSEDFSDLDEIALYDRGAGPFERWLFESDGVLMIGDITIVSNISVSDDRQNAYEALMMMHPYMIDGGVVFNEYYLYRVDESNSFWSVIPIGIKYVLFQGLIVLVLIILKRGKRFGEPKVYYEESEHGENAYALSVGELFYRAKHYDALLESFFNDFIDKLSKKYFVYGDINAENFPEVYKEGPKKDYKRALLISKYMNSYYENKGKVLEHKKKTNRSNKKIKDILIQIQKLEQNLDKEE